MDRNKEEVNMKHDKKYYLENIFPQDPNIKEVFRVDKEGFAYGLYITNELFVGSLYDMSHADFYPDNETIRLSAENKWRINSFAMEVK